MHSNKLCSETHAHPKLNNNVCCACRPIFKGKVKADNDYKLPMDEGRKEAGKREIYATG